MGNDERQTTLMNLLVLPEDIRDLLVDEDLPNLNNNMNGRKCPEVCVYVPCERWAGCWCVSILM